MIPGRCVLLLPAALAVLSVVFAERAGAQSRLPERREAEESPSVRFFPLESVRLLDGVFRRAQEVNGRYLLALDSDRLLSNFRQFAGLAPKGEPYGGWEGDTIAGHSLGHYLGAVSLQYASTGDEAFRTRATYVVSELRACQLANGDGFVFGFPRGKEIFAELRRGDIRARPFDLNGCWVPLYNLHKTFAGLLEAHRHCGSEEALVVATALANFLVDVFAELNEEQMQSMLDAEQGGIAESFADLSSLTGDARHLAMAERLCHRKVLDPLAAREDRLDGLHGNTQIPKVLGAARLFELTGKTEYRTMASFFWQTVVDHHTYVNGGHGDSEYFGPPDRLSKRLGDTTETCNTYNMLRLTRFLFRWQPRAEQFDYYERALLNHILAHQHPETGMFVYKGLMDMPARKGFSSPFDSFWCCVGTGMENHAKYGESIFAREDDALFVNLYVSSRLTWRERGVTVVLESSLPFGEEVVLRVRTDAPIEMPIHLREPGWARGRMQVHAVDARLTPGGRLPSYVTVERTWHDGDELRIVLPMELRYESMPDDSQRIAFFHGPTLLCFDLGQDDPVPTLVAEQGKLLDVFTPDPEAPLTFRTKGDALILRPHFAVRENLYTVYVDALTPEQWTARQEDEARERTRHAELAARTLDEVQFGLADSERAHALTHSEKSYAGTYQGRRWRDARDGGFIAFDLRIDPAQPLELLGTYWGGERRRRFDILVDDVVVGTQVLERLSEGEFVEVAYPVPAALTRGKERVRVTMRGCELSHVGRVFGCRALRRSE